MDRWATPRGLLGAKVTAGGSVGGITGGVTVMVLTTGALAPLALLAVNVIV